LFRVESQMAADAIAQTPFTLPGARRASLIAQCFSRLIDPFLPKRLFRGAIAFVEDAEKRRGKDSACFRERFPTKNHPGEQAILQ
jgi:hypothetical protein